jgi:hypothetical protein
MVDAHQHVWQIGRHDYFWLAPELPIHRDYGLDELRPQLGGIGATVLVQAAPSVAETNDLIAIAAASQGLVRGVVGWVDLASGAAVDELVCAPCSDSSTTRHGSFDRTSRLRSVRCPGMACGWTCPRVPGICP